MPYAPGGATDIIGRVIAEELSQSIGQRVVVENRAGAAGSVGAAAVARATPDGYLLLMGALTSHSINMGLQAKPGFDLKKDFSPVSSPARSASRSSCTPRCRPRRSPS